MNTTGICTTQLVKINLKSVAKPIILYPFGDIHRSSNMCSVEAWQEFLSKAKSECRDNLVLFLGMGDYDDLCSTSERPIVFNDALHDSTKAFIKNTLDDNVNRLCREMDFMKGRLIGLLEGNHFGTYENGTTTTQRMCEKLGCKYLGCVSMIRLYLNRNTARVSIDIFAHHGKGASRLAGSSINTVQQMAEAVEADIFVQGHDHKRGAMPMSKLRLIHNYQKGAVEIQARKQLYIRSGSFLKGYEDGQKSYVADKLLNPTDLGVVKVKIKITKNDNLPIKIDLGAEV
jgi:hypothetical protein